MTPQDYSRAVLEAVRGGAGTANNILLSVRGRLGVDQGPEWLRSYRAVDRALQALRKAKKIKFGKGSPGCGTPSSPARQWRVI